MKFSSKHREEVTDNGRDVAVMEGVRGGRRREGTGVEGSQIYDWKSQKMLKGKKELRNTLLHDWHAFLS